MPHYGKLFGLMIFMGSVAQFVQIPLLRWAEHSCFRDVRVNAHSWIRQCVQQVLPDKGCSEGSFLQFSAVSHVVFAPAQMLLFMLAMTSLALFHPTLIAVQSRRRLRARTAGSTGAEARREGDNHLPEKEKLNSV